MAKVVFALMLAILTTIAVFISPQYDASVLTMVTASSNLAFGIIAAFMYYFYSKTLLAKDAKISLRPSSLLFALGLSFFLILGESFRLHDDLRLIFAGGSIRPSFFVFLLGYIPFFYTVAELAISYLSKYAESPGGETAPSPAIAKCTAISSFILDKRPVLFPMLFLIAAWLPYIVMHFPGSATWDATWQIEEFMGVRSWSQHHPLLSTMFFGALFRIGIAISDANTNVALFLITVTQTLMLSASLAFALYKTKTWHVAPLIRFAILLFFAFNPWIAIQSQSIVKDVTALPFITMFSLYMLELVRKIKFGEAVGKSTWIPLAVFAVLAALWRNPNVYIIVLSLLPLLLFKQAVKQRLCLALCILGIFLVQFAATNALASLTDAREGCVFEALSIPLQQTARFVRDAPEEVTEEERQAIDNLLVFDNLADVYTSRISDPVRRQLRHNEEGVSEYFRHWFAMGLRRPDIYIKATLSNSFSYFAPARNFYDPRNTNVHFHNRQVFDNIAGIENIQNTDFRELVRYRIFWFTGLPLISLLFQLANITWILILCILVLFVKKRKGFIAGFLPVLWTIAVCMASPVNGYLRYYLPVYVLFPILLAYMIAALKQPPRQAQKKIGVEAI